MPNCHLLHRAPNFTEPRHNHAAFTDMNPSLKDTSDADANANALAKPGAMVNTFATHTSHTATNVSKTRRVISRSSSHKHLLSSTFQEQCNTAIVTDLCGDAHFTPAPTSHVKVWCRCRSTSYPTMTTNYNSYKHVSLEDQNAVT